MKHALTDFLGIPVVFVLFWLALSVAESRAYDAAPPLSDREIVESLTELKQNQKNLVQRIDDTNRRIDDMNQSINSRIDMLILTIDKRFDAVDKRFDAMDKRFESMQKNMDARFEAMQKNMDARFEAIQKNMDARSDAVDKRFETMDKRFEEQHNMILTLFGSVMALVIALMGYMIWDRKTAQEPVKKRVGILEENMETVSRGLISIERKTENAAASAQVLQRVVASLQDFSRKNSEMADSLKSHSLL